MKPKATLTDQDIAAIASGASAEVIAAASAAALEAANKGGDTAAEKAAAQAVVDAAKEAAKEPSAAAKDTPAAVKDTPAATDQTSLVNFLQAQVKEKDALLTQAAIERNALDAKLAGIEATHNALLDIARASVGKMQVALGGTATDLKTASPAAVLEEHTRVAAVFADKFKVGGVGAVVPEDAHAAKEAVADGKQSARVNAVRFPSKKK